MKWWVIDEFGSNRAAGPFNSKRAAQAWIAERKAALDARGGLPLEGTSHQGDVDKFTVKRGAW